MTVARPADAWLAAVGQRRTRPLSATLAAAREAAVAAGVTRLADVSGLAPCGVPVFQAVRPLARLLSVSQGKGLSRMAAMVSALLEAIEFDIAEHLPAPATLTRLGQLDAATRATWQAAPRSALGIRLDPDRPRPWLVGHDLVTGRTMPMPWDLLSLDVRLPAAPDVRPVSVGLATGNDVAEATVGAVAELLEHDLQATTVRFTPRDWRACQLDLDSVDEPLAHRLLRRLASRGFTVRVWSLGQDAGIAAFRCALADLDGDGAQLPPAGGSGCHPDRGVALLRAVLEAVQSRVTIVAGARDDLTVADYSDGPSRTLELAFGTLAFGPGPLAWADVPHHALRDTAADLDVLLTSAVARTSLPVLLYTHAAPHPQLAVVHALAPGLADLHRQPEPAIATAGSMVATRFRASPRPVVFVGPTLTADLIPCSIEVRPPAVCGDIAALLADPPPAVGIIDGCFATAPTIWHKEILDLIALGVPVFGGASLGAVRAAELDGLGMFGVGAIFAAYRRGWIERDDAVMLSHGPAAVGFAPLTVALVDAEAALLQCPIALDERRQLQRIVRTVPFARRTWAHCLDLFRVRTGRAASVTAAALAAVPSLKQRDALRMVERLGSARRQPRRPRPPLTQWYLGLLAAQSPAPSAGHPSAATHAPAA